MAEAGSEFCAVLEMFNGSLGPVRGVTLRSGETLFDTDVPHSDVFFIRTGEVRVFQIGGTGGLRLGGIFGPGDWIGAAALAGIDFAGRAVASVATEVSVVAASQLVEQLRQRPDVAVAMLKQTAARLMGAYDDAARLVFDDCHERLMTALIALSDSPTAVRHGQNVTVRITHQQLAQAVGAARETISLALTDLRHRNLLETGRNRLIFNPDALRACPTHHRARKEKSLRGSLVQPIAV